MSVWLKCQRCGYIWEYKGYRSRATCPKCNTCVMVSRSAIDESIVPEDVKRKVEERKRKRIGKIRLLIVRCPICGRSFVYSLDACVNGVDVLLDLREVDLYGNSFKEHVVKCVVNEL